MSDLASFEIVLMVRNWTMQYNSLNLLQGQCFFFRRHIPWLVQKVIVTSNYKKQGLVSMVCSVDYMTVQSGNL